MLDQKTSEVLKYKTSWKVQLITSIVVGALFGTYHFMLSPNEVHIFFYYFVCNTLLSLGLWQAARITFVIINKQFSWFERPFLRIVSSLAIGALFTYIVIFIADFWLPFLVDPLFKIDSNNLAGQPTMSVATFFLDGTISLFIFLFYLTFINLFSYFNESQDKKIKEAEKSIENYFGTLIENIHDVIQVVDEDGRKIYCSQSILSLTGYTADEVKAMKIGFEIVHHSDREFITNELKENIKNNFVNYTTRCRAITKDGKLKYIESKFINAKKNPLLNGYIVIMSDVTEKVRSEEQSKHQKELYQLLTDISTYFLNSKLITSVEAMLEKVGRFSKVDRTYVYLLNKSATHWNCLHEWRSISAEDIESNYYISGIPVNQSPWLLNQIKQNLIINFEDIELIPSVGIDFKNVCQTDKTKSILIIPMIRNEKIFGFMGFDSVLNKKTWKEEDISTLQICSEILISSILRKDAEQEIQRSLSVNKAIVDSTSEGILLTDLNDNILYYNQNFKDMWMLDEKMLSEGKKSVALNYAIKNVINAPEIYGIISTSEENADKRVRFEAHLKNNRVLEGISQPQIIDGKVVGRVWSNRDITDRVNAEKEEIEKSFALAQFESLKNQVNPHFLFNSLNVLSSLVHIDAELSEKFIDQLARSYRYLLEQKDNEIVLLKTEIDFVQSFTFLLKIRFEEKLQVNIHVNAQIMQYYVAPLTLQLLIENAVKHNIISMETPLVINIYTENDEYLIVSNNLQLREQQLPSTGVGLKNINDRYKLLTQKPTEFYIENNIYISRIPLIKTIQS
jgi:two-component system, LytTR family, sensor kinase